MARSKSRSTVALLLLLSGVGPACGRTPMAESGGAASVRVDAAHSFTDVGPKPDAESSTPDTAPDTRADLGTDTAAPPAGVTCSPGPREVTRLITFDNDEAPNGLAAFQGSLFTALSNNASIRNPPDAQFTGISVASGQKMYIDITNVYPLGVQACPTGLLLIGGMATATATGWSVLPSRLSFLDAKSKLVSQLANPPELASSRLLNAACNTKGDVFWVLDEPSADQCFIVRWDPVTRTSRSLLDGALVTNLLADNSTLYWSSRDNDGHVIFVSSPIAGGSKTVLLDTMIPWSEEPWLVGLDDTQLYFAVSKRDAPGIFALPKTGGSPRPLISDTNPGLVHMDSGQFYWVDSFDSSHLLRAPKAGGQPEVFWDGSGRWVDTFTMDDCNVYWLVRDPSEIFYRAK